MSDQESDGIHEESSPACSSSEDVDDSIIISELSDEETEGKAHKTAGPSTQSDSSSLQSAPSSSSASKEAATG